MHVISERGAGSEVHTRTVVVWVLVTAPDGSVQREVQTCGTMTADRLALSDWLEARTVRHVAMESTGVFWKPVYTLVEEGRTILLVNPQHLKVVPGRQTDVRDSEWLADRLRQGLLTASCIPPQPVRDLRELTRSRTTLVQERAQEVNRLQPVLERANLKRAAVATDGLGKSGRAMLAARLGGEQDPDTLAEVARGRLRAKLPELRQALEGRGRAVPQVQLRVLLAPIAFLEGALVQLQEEIAPRLDPFAEAVALAQSLPGGGETAASALLAAVGPDLPRFPTHTPLAAWAGVCPGNTHSGGKRLSSTTTHGTPWRRRLLAEVAWAISHTTDTYLAAQFQRLARRLGKQKAVVAISHRVLVIRSHLVRDHPPSTDLGPDYFAQLDRQRLERHHVHRLEQLGDTVTLPPAPAA